MSEFRYLWREELYPWNDLFYMQTSNASTSFHMKVRPDTGYRLLDHKLEEKPF